MQNKNLKPPFKWIGGKRKLLSQLTKLLPKTFNTYYEPFVGGGALLFHLHPQQAVINDYNQELINVYQAIKNQPEELIQQLQKMSNNNSKAYYLKIRALDRQDSYNSLSDLFKAARFMYMLRVDFNGIYRVNSHNQFNVPYGRYKHPQIINPGNIHAVSNYLNHNHVTITSGDFAKSLETTKAYDFVYLDPPYIPLNSTSDFTSYTKKGFNLADQKRLVKTCNQLNNQHVYFMESNSDTPLTRQLYQKYNIHSVQVNRSINGNAKTRGKINELIITNY